jgi:hypothetical protein
MHFGGIPFGGMPGGMGGMGGGRSEDVDTEKLYEVLGVAKDANEKVRLLVVEMKIIVNSVGLFSHLQILTSSSSSRYLHPTTGY